MSNNDDEFFNPDHIPSKIPFVLPVNQNTGLNTITYNAEAPFTIRRVLLEKAIPHFPELANLDIKKVLVLSNTRT
jgi:hypothetical protein